MSVLEDIALEIRKCRNCKLSETRLNPVSGAGGHSAGVVLVGEAPGREEDKTGKPFVGSAGRVLDKLLSSAGLSRDEVFITNLVKCRPPGNRDPEGGEILACSHHLNRQIELLSPKVILCLGKFASSYLLEKYGFEKQSISSAHGKPFKKNTLNGKIVLVPMFHPAAALYDPEKMSMMIEDFKLIPILLDRHSTKQSP